MTGSGGRGRYPDLMIGVETKNEQKRNLLLFVAYGGISCQSLSFRYSGGGTRLRMGIVGEGESPPFSGYQPIEIVVTSNKPIH